MIKNRFAFYLGLVLIAIAAWMKYTHGEAIASLARGVASIQWEGLGDDFWGRFADFLVNYKLWGLVGVAFFILSIFKGSSASATSPVEKRFFDRQSFDAIPKTLESLCGKTPPDVPLIVDYIVYQAICHNASDIHFDPSSDGIVVRFRLQGLARTVGTIPRTLTHTITNRLKILSNLVIYQDMTPQDGRFDRDNQQEMGASLKERELKRSGLSKTDFRIAFMPTLHGERIVIRILGNKDETTDINDLGLQSDELSLIRRLIAQPQGMIVMTGPTGSGKTTTIFAVLQEILRTSGKQRSIATLEDPIEFDFDNINQSQVNEERNFTFDKGLRAILRQDPDVIMVGEIRDVETARIAIQAGMTGHLLITTVHTNSSAAAFARLYEMGIPPYSLNSAITAVVAQRLVQRICPNCKIEREKTEHDKKLLKRAKTGKDIKLYMGQGCEQCDDTGYSGRIAIYEILEVSEKIRSIISEGVDIDSLYATAQSEGMRTLWDAGIEKVEEGITSLEELERAIWASSK